MDGCLVRHGPSKTRPNYLFTGMCACVRWRTSYSYGNAMEMHDRWQWPKSGLRTIPEALKFETQYRRPLASISQLHPHRPGVSNHLLYLSSHWVSSDSFGSHSTFSIIDKWTMACIICSHVVIDGV